MASLNRKLTNKTVSKKFKSLKDLEMGLTNKNTVEKYCVSRNIFSTLEKKDMSSKL